MGYVEDRPLESLFREEPVRACSERITRRAAEDLRERVRRHTPIAKPPAASVAGEWLAARKRLPGTLRESWEIGEVTVVLDGQRMSVPVFTRDPIAPHVEWPTMPHLIVPRRRGGVLRYWNRAGETVFARVVHHPGTQGVHMMATALVELAASWEGIADEEIARWAREAFV